MRLNLMSTFSVWLHISYFDFCALAIKHKAIREDIQTNNPLHINYKRSFFYISSCNLMVLILLVHKRLILI